MEFSRTKAWGCSRDACGSWYAGGAVPRFGVLSRFDAGSSILERLASLLLLWKPRGFPGGFSGLERGRLSPQEFSRTKVWRGLGDCG